MARRPPVSLALSVAGHALLLGGLALATRPAPAERATAVTGIAAAARAASQPAARLVAIEREQRARVAEARAARAAGTLALGEFVIRAGALDAEERGRAVDVGEAQRRYDERRAKLAAALRRAPVREAVPEVLADLRYHGQPGGLVADLLLDGGGSCEPIAQLVASLLYDSGRKAEAGLRYYGGDSGGGVSHLAPVDREPGGEIDLMTGEPAAPGGAALAAADLVDVYARAHGLDAPAPAVSAAKGGDGPAPAAGAAALAADGRISIAAGLPPNEARFPGALPLFSTHALRRADPDGAPAENFGAVVRGGRDCAIFLPMSKLSPPEVEVDVDGATLAVEPRRAPRPEGLERRSGIIAALEEVTDEGTPKPLGAPSPGGRPEPDEVDRLMAWACLAALYDEAVTDFGLSGEPELASLAERKRRAASARGARAIAAARATADGGARLRAELAKRLPGRGWPLLLLAGGDTMLLDLARESDGADWGRVNLLAALVVYPPTRVRAIDLLRDLDPVEQVEVMHEVFLAHDHLRPWSSNFELDAGPRSGAEFVLAYSAFRRMSYRLWEFQPVDEVVPELDADLRARGLGIEWEAALLPYYARNAVNIRQNRPDGFASVVALRRALRGRRHPELELLARRLQYIEGQGQLDAVTLADAWRVR